MSNAIKPEARHLEHLAFLQLADMGSATEAGGDWCDIRRLYPVGQHYRGSYTIFGYGADLVFTINPDGTARVVQLVVLGTDRTQEALANGGGSIALTPNSRYGHDCKTSDSYLAWEMTGQFVDWAASFVERSIKIARPSDFLLYARYNGPTDPKKWFYFYLAGWKYAELQPVS